MVTPSLYPGKAFPTFEMEGYRNLDSVDFPRTSDGDLAGTVHPQLQVSVKGRGSTLSNQASCTSESRAGPEAGPVHTHTSPLKSSYSGGGLLCGCCPPLIGEAEGRGQNPSDRLGGANILFPWLGEQPLSMSGLSTQGRC